MYEFLSIILIVFGILQIILFFKTWIMTNDVKKIKEIAQEGNNSSWDVAKIETLAGNYDKAFEIYQKCFISDVYEMYSSTMRAIRYEYSEGYDKIVKKYKKQLETLKGDYSIDFEKYDTREKIREMIFRA
ncbi:hypothetical protein [uncultured Bacteroides sp.]|uniref:hypothetical protein n=1 Tax=uncultured Bacteroides sp. TaxID=162156 RepID=UPI002AAB4B61|nr:hypothetical protein [uncultured Bacteroides sp.]